MSSSTGEPTTLEEALAALEKERRGRRQADMTNQRLEERLAARDTDPVSLLPLQHLFDERLAEKVAEMIARPEARPYLEAKQFSPLLYPPPHGSDQMSLALGFADIWLLREWNDRFNHGVGDAVLRGFGDAVRAHQVPWLTAYRAGKRGDEFKIIVYGKQGDIVNNLEQVKATMATTPVPEGNPFGAPTFDIGFCTIYEALWAYARIITETPQRGEHDAREEITRVKELLTEISDTRGRVQKVLARALHLVELKRKDPENFVRISKPLFGGTHLDPEDVTYLLGIQDSEAPPSTIEAEFQRIAARPWLNQWEDHRKRFASLRGMDGSDSLKGQVIIETALHMGPFRRRYDPDAR